MSAAGMTKSSFGFVAQGRPIRGAVGICRRDGDPEGGPQGEEFGFVLRRSFLDLHSAAFRELSDTTRKTWRPCQSFRAERISTRTGHVLVALPLMAARTTPRLILCVGLATVGRTFSSVPQRRDGARPKERAECNHGSEFVVGCEPGDATKVLVAPLTCAFESTLQTTRNVE